MTIFSHPEMPPKNSVVRIAELAHDSDANHKVGDLVIVSGNNFTNDSHDDNGDPCYHAAKDGTFGSWVRKVELVQEKNKTDHVNPKHYKLHPSGIEAIQITEWFSGNIAQCFQYFWRAGLKGDEKAISDMQKGVWFANRELMRMGGESMLKEGLQGPPVLGGDKE